MMILRAAVLWAALGSAAGSAGQPASWTVAADGRAATVTTATLRATFRDGTLVSIVNRTGGDSLFVAQHASTASAALKDAVGFATVDRSTRVTCARRGTGVRFSLQGLSNDATARMTIAIGAEPDGTITVQASGQRAKPRLISGHWGIAGIDATHARMVLPANGGQIVDSLKGPGTLALSWPSNWQAALIVLQGASGGVSVWAEDPDAQFKSADARRVGKELTLSFGSETRAPYDDARSFTGPVWRVQAHKGDWKVPALAYRSRMARAQALTPIAARKPEWVRDIRLVVRVAEPDANALAGLRDLAKHIDPSQTLLYVPTWRKLPYDVLYPDYTPREGFVAWSRAAKAMGYRVMVHGNLAGIGPTSPELPKVERFIQTDRAAGNRVGWYLDRPNDPGQIYCLNPASAEVRRFLIDHFRRAWEEVRFDALHLDFPVLVSTREGDIEGMTTVRGAEVYLREMQAALPDVAFGTEGLNEALLPCSFAQVGEPFWVSRTSGIRTHPIRSLLFAQYCGLYGHLGLPDQEKSFGAFLSHHDFFDLMGAWPTLTLDSALDASAQGTDFVLREAQYFQRHRLMPAPDQVRDPAELFAWRGHDGAISAVFDTPPGRRLAPRLAPDKPVWSLLSKVNAYDGPGTVADWRAFDGRRLFGLDPEQRYSVSSGAPDPKVLHLVASSRPIVLREVRDNTRRALFGLAGQSAVVADLVECAASAATGIIVGGRQEPLGSGASFSAQQAASGGEALPAISAHPPWQGATAGGSAYGEFVVSVPANGRTVLRFAIGLGDLPNAQQAADDKVAPLSDGVTFVVSAQGRVLFTEHHARRAWVWREVDLTRFRGKSIILRLATGPGPRKNPAWDWALWGKPQVLNGGGGPGELLRLQVYAPHGRGTAIFGDPDRPGRVVRAQAAPGGGVLLEIELPRPQPFGLLYAGTPVAAGTDLADLPLIAGSTSGGLLREGSIYGSGTVGGSERDGRVIRVINGHPPTEGRTSLDWTLSLPPEPLKLSFLAQVLPGGGAVGFEVQVNGRPVWKLPMPYPVGWKAGTVDLSPWAGKQVLVSLVSDSAGANLCDWAQSGEVRLTAR